MNKETETKLIELFDKFNKELLELGFEIDHSCEYISILKCIKTNIVVADLYDNNFLEILED